MFQQLQRRLVEQAPRLLRRPLKLVPFTLQQNLMEALLGRVFREAIEEGEFAFLAGKWLKVEVSDLGLCWFISGVLRREWRGVKVPGHAQEVLDYVKAL